MVDTVSQWKILTVDGNEVRYVPESLSYNPFVITSKEIMDTATNMEVKKYQVNDLTADITTKVSFQLIPTEDNISLFEEWRRKGNNGEYVVLNLYRGININDGINFTLENCRLESGVSDIMKQDYIDVSFLGNEVKNRG